MRAARGGRSPRPSADYSTVFAGGAPACLGAGRRLRLASRPSTDLTCSVTLSKVPTGTMTRRGCFCPENLHFYEVWGRAGGEEEGRKELKEEPGVRGRPWRLRGHRPALSCSSLSPSLRNLQEAAGNRSSPPQLSASRPGKHKRPGPEVKVELAREAALLSGEKRRKGLE